MRQRRALRSRRDRPAWLWLGMLGLTWVLLPCGAALAQDPVYEPGLELTSPVRQQLRLLNEAWRSWTRAYYQGDEDAASGALDQLRSTAAGLGMSRLPDLSTAASVFAVQAAREDDFERARWALAAARELDPDRPETDFSGATIRRLEGDFPGALSSSVKGYLGFLWLPLERSIWLHDVGLWLLYVMIISGGIFLALQMATKGGSLFHDLARFMSPPLALATADALTLAALVWPLILPSGLLWLALYWSILLWGYGSLSEKLVFVVLWLTLGVMPLVLSFQQKTVQLSLAPPVRAMDHVTAGRLYGALFSDLGVLRTLMPDHPVAREVVADVHRRFGQWEHARSTYTTLLETGGVQGERAAPARNNVGVYHHRRKDFGTAVNYFAQASREDPTLAEAFFNLAQAYSQLYKFSDSNLAMARAKELDRSRVNVWERAQVPVEENAIGVDGGLKRAEELRAQLRSTWYGSEESSTALDLWRRHLSLSVMAGVLLLAVTVHLVRSQLGYRSDLLEDRALLSPAVDRWLRALVPGLHSVRNGRGAAAFLAITVPVALLLVVPFRGLSYRVPLGYDPGPWLPATLGLGGLAVVFLLRLGLTWKRR